MVCRVVVFLALENRADVSIVYGLSEGAAQVDFASEGLSECRVGFVEISEGELNVAYSVKCNHTIFAGVEASVGRLFGEVKRLVVEFGRFHHVALATVVGADVVQSLHTFDGVVDSERTLQSVGVSADGIVELVAVAQFLSQLFARENNAVDVTVGCKSVVERLQGVGIAFCFRNQIPDIFFFGIGYLVSVLSTCR